MRAPGAIVADTRSPASLSAGSPARAGRRADPIRLFQFTAFLAIGGTERQVLNVTGGLDPSGFAVQLGCFGHHRDQVAVESVGVPVTLYPVDSLYGLRTLRQVLRLSADLKRQRIDILHAYNFYANVFAVPAARLARVPVVLAAIRDTGGQLTPRQRRTNKLACRLADRVVVNAEAIKAGLIAEGYRPDRIVVLHNGIVCHPLKTAEERRAVRHALGVPADAPLVGVVARISRAKGLEYFVQAARAVLDRTPDARFLLVGDTNIDRPYREDLQRLSCRLGLNDRLMFTGFRTDIPDLLSALTVSVLPSLEEGLSNALLESMAAAVPVVATNVGGNPEVVVDGVTGLLVPPKHPAALAQAIGRVLDAPVLAQSMGRAGRRRVLDHFTNERMIRKMQRLYEELLEQARAGRPRPNR
ncbi:glycosyltransferase [Nitrospira moscoviensis]|uniref:Putative Glycosyl transferase group 1 n=1 Tax=Nitrospira moscoviensis TaxID=42253 RepID=A0A0K2GDN1_NITMO|nr:glycosyltransferase [Nitrospira moscoviensis]ALA59058.1 putative Glycosyl transferase group 1 [Nitrospira moscoviensis]